LRDTPDALPIPDPWHFIRFSIERHRFGYDPLTMPTLMATWSNPNHKVPVAGLIKTFMVDAIDTLPNAIAYVQRNGFTNQFADLQAQQPVSDGARA
jgi:hypothetical protein